MSKLTQAQAIDLAAYMLRVIANGGSFDFVDYYQFLHAIEETKQ
jgi:hypothetical protein